jgi:hypothetical protein
MIDPTLRSSIAALLRLAADASPLPWLNDENPFSSGPDVDGSDEDIEYTFAAAHMAPQLARLVLQLEQELEAATALVGKPIPEGIYVSSTGLSEEEIKLIEGRRENPVPSRAGMKGGATESVFDIRPHSC